MTEQFGIKLSVSVADLLASVNSAVDSVNNSPKLHKLKLGINTSAVDAAVKKMRADLSSISLKVGAPKINLEVSTSDVKSQLGGAALISEQSVNAQSGMLDKLTADYTKYFNIVSRRADETAQEIRTKFKGALSDTLGAMSSGDKGQIQSAFDNLTKMTQDYSKTIKNTRGEDIFQDFKNSYLKSWVPVSKSIKSDLEYIYGKGKSLANVLTGAFGVGNWKYVDPGNIHSTDKWLRQFDGTAFSNWANGNTVDGFAQCIDHINTIKELAKEKVTLFTDGTFNTKSIVDFVTEFYNLNNAQNSVVESAKKLQQVETETVNAVNQSAAAVKNLAASEENAVQQQTFALQSYETVLQKFEALQNGGFSKYIPSNAKDMMIDVTASEKSAAAVDALGRSFDRIANLPIEEKTRAFKEIMAALSAYASADKLVPENLIKNLNDVCVGITDVEKAQKNETAAAEKAKQAVMGQSEEIKKQNKLLRIRKGISALTGDVVKHETYGTANKNVTFKYRNGSLESAFSVQNIAAQTEMFNKANAAAEEYLLKVNELVRKNTDANKQKAIKDPVHLEELNKQFEKVKQSITALRGASKETFTSLKSDVETQKTLLSQMADAFKDAEYPGTTLAPKSVETWKQVYSARLDEFVAKNNGTGGLVAAKSELEELRTLLNNITDSASFSKFNDKFDILKAKVKAVNAEMKTAADTAAHIDSGIKSLDRITGDNALAKNSAANMPKYNEIIDKAVSIRNQYQQLLSSLKNDGSAENLAKVKEQVVALDKEMKEAVNTATAFKRELGADRNGEILAKKAAQTHALITDIMNKNALGMNKINTLSGSGLTFGEEFQRLNAQLTETPGLVDSINAKVRTLEAQMKQLGYTGNTLWGDLKEKAVKFIKWTGMTLLITKVRTYFRKLFTTVYELDTALIDLKKTFNGTNDELNDFYFEANRLAKQMGVTTKEIIEQGSAFSRLGYSSNETMKQMAKMSSMFAAISPDMNTEQATDGLVSIMKAFDIDPKNVLDGILSKVNIIGNTAATSNGEIVEMLEKSSSAMKEANNTLEETIALETAAVEITRDASSVGNAYKTNYCLYVQKCA